MCIRDRGGNIPDYDLTLGEDDLLRVVPQVVVEPPLLAVSLGPLAEATLQSARARAGGWDIYALEAEWRGTVSYTHLDVYKRQPQTVERQPGGSGGTMATIPFSSGSQMVPSSRKILRS